MPPKRKAGKTQVVYSKLKVVELQDECVQRGLDSKGKKAELVQRLNDYEVNNNNDGEPSVKVKKEEDAEEEEEVDMESMTMKEKLKKLAEEEKRNKKKTFQVDSCCPGAGIYKVHEDYDCMLNQTNIGKNNNKFYIIQILEASGNYHCWNRWGRVGETGSNSIKSFGTDLGSAEKDFKKKFRDKTKNSWDDRENFTPVPGKYTLIEMDAQDETDNAEMVEKLEQLDDASGVPAPVSNKKVKKCTLDEATQSLIKLIFNNDMFKEQMAKMNIDVKKMPLGKLSKSQIAKGFEVLEELEEAIKGNKRSSMETLTSRFYTLIPHSFGRQRPPLIGDTNTVSLKYDMLSVLGDIEIAQNLQKVEVKKEEEEELDHPLDLNYNVLKCGLKHLDPDSERFKLIKTYTDNTKTSSGWNSGIELLDVWEVEREGSSDRFAEHKDITHRKLLWHGTNVAVVVAILKTGLRIMPHSGGRVGSGIYFASENGKSSAYVGTSGDGTGIMFLNEVALGKQNVITQDDSSLKKAPTGFDSVLAQGTQEPDSKGDVKIDLDGNEIIVPTGKPKNTSVQSSFYQSEYLVYKESQCCIRYLLKFKFR